MCARSDASWPCFNNQDLSISDIPQQAHAVSHRGAEDRHTDAGGVLWRSIECSFNLDFRWPSSSTDGTAPAGPTPCLAEADPMRPSSW
jgi:hypothetical protein